MSTVHRLEITITDEKLVAELLVKEQAKRFEDRRGPMSDAEVRAFAAGVQAGYVRGLRQNAGFKKAIAALWDSARAMGAVVDDA